jgi:hypothetical protein
VTVNLFYDARSLEQAVFEAVGAASVAWMEPPTSEFDTEFAHRVAIDLLTTIARLERGETNA